MFKGIFFDLYDTLIITDEHTASAWLGEFYSCLKYSGLTRSFKEFASLCEGFFGWYEPLRLDDGLTVYERRIKAFCSDLKLPIDDTRLHEVAGKTVAAATGKCRLDPHCHAVLETLGGKFILALISNYDHPPCLRQTLRELELEKYFSRIIISGEVGMKKPDKGIFQLALRETGLKPSEVVYVGDSVANDASGAVSAGMLPVLIQRNAAKDDFRWDREPRAAQLSPQIKIIRRLPELLSLVITT